MPIMLCSDTQTLWLFVPLLTREPGTELSEQGHWGTARSGTGQVPPRGIPVPWLQWYWGGGVGGAGQEVSSGQQGTCGSWRPDFPQSSHSV